MATDSDPSPLRQRVHRTTRQLLKEVDALLEPGPFIRGSVYPLRRKCGKPGCRCQQGALHQSLVLAVPENGRKRIRTVPKGQHQQWQLLANRYRRFRRSRAQLVKLFARLMSMIDELEKQRTIPPPHG